MASEKDICIYALQHVGQFADMVSLDEDSSHAVVTRTTYPFVRDALLERHTWNFATRVKRIPAFENADGVLAFALPSDCIRVVEVRNSKVRPRDAELWPMDWQTQIIGTQRCIVVDEPAEELTIRYVARITNTEMYTPGFVEALSWNLAAAVAGPIIKGDTGITVQQKLVQYAQAFEARAANIDAGQGQKQRVQRLAPWHTPRAVSRHFVYYTTPMDDRGDFEL